MLLFLKRSSVGALAQRLDAHSKRGKIGGARRANLGDPAF